MRASGEEFPLEASLSKLVTERGILMTVVLRDVTALHVSRAERQARVRSRPPTGPRPSSCRA